VRITQELNDRYEGLGFKLSRRLDAYAGGLVEAICEHGIGHPIPESVTERDQKGPKGAKGSWNLHGCDGCCARFWSPAPATSNP